MLRLTKPLLAVAISLTFMVGCTEKTKETDSSIRLITLDPGHFHAALVQKSMYPDVNPVVHVYAPEGEDVKLHLDKIEAYNKRPENPTKWDEKVYTGTDYLEKMLSDKSGNVVVLAGNNQKKPEYIQKSVQAGLHVLSDKPMIIQAADFDKLKSSFSEAEKNKVLLYDIMTERFEISTVLQREFSRIASVFGTLEKGTPDKPAVTKESVHHFYKYVSGKVLTRPSWFMDVNQQGEGIVDVTTHLVDLVQWECFPEKVIDYTKDIQLTSARRWPTEMTRSQFKTITKQADFPAYLKGAITRDSVLNIYSNGEINYQLNGIHAKVSVTWAYKAPEGGGDTHYSIMRGTKANLVIRQGPEQKYVPTLYIEPIAPGASYEKDLNDALLTVQKNFPGVELSKEKKGWKVVVPEKYAEGHEAHFGRVTENFLKYLKSGQLPAWEVPNMLAKYYTTTQALELAKKSVSKVK